MFASQPIIYYKNTWWFHHQPLTCRNGLRGRLDMRKTARFLYQFYKWLVYAPFLGLSTAFFSLLLIAFSFFSQRAASKWCGLFWGRLNTWVGLNLVTVSGRLHLRRHPAYIIAANHQSLIDIPVLYGWLGLDLKWVMKKELRKVPFMGMAAERAGHIIIDRSDSQAAIFSINAAREKLRPGTSIIFFPEGTRSRDGHLGAFKKGAFRLALDLGLPILPVTLTGTRDILPPDGMDLLPGHARMIIHAPIATSGAGIEQLEALMAQTRQIIQSALPGEPSRQPAPRWRLRHDHPAEPIG
jgi:1-acyl-sn-glycerol-3-phosphate acyltransferase